MYLGATYVTLLLQLLLYPIYTITNISATCDDNDDDDYRDRLITQRLQNQVADNSTVVHVHSWTKRAVDAGYSYLHSSLSTEFATFNK